MTHPLARFAASVREQREAGITPRPVVACKAEINPDWPVEAGQYVVGIERWSVDAALPIDRLAILAARTSDGLVLHPDLAERVLMGTLAANPQPVPIDDADIASAVAAFKSIVRPGLDVERENFEQAEAARHYDLVDTQRALIQEHKRRRKEQAREKIRKLKLDGGAGRRRIAWLEERKLEKFLFRMDLKLEQIRQHELAINFEGPQLVGIALLELEQSAPQNCEAHNG